MPAKETRNPQQDGNELTSLSLAQNHLKVRPTHSKRIMPGGRAPKVKSETFFTRFVQLNPSNDEWYMCPSFRAQKDLDITIYSQRIHT